MEEEEGDGEGRKIEREREMEGERVCVSPLLRSMFDVDERTPPEIEMQR